MKTAGQKALTGIKILVEVAVAVSAALVVLALLDSIMDDEAEERQTGTYGK